MSKIVRTPTRAEGGLTPEEEIKMKAHAELWINRAMRTDPIEPDKIVPAIKSLYTVSGLKEPRVVIVPSPRVMAFAGGFASAIWWMRKNPGNPFATRAATDATTDAATYVATYVATRAATTYVATRAATDAATDDATADATSAATRAATADATADAATDATADATADATYAATRAATADATYAATRAATAAATYAATAATYAATRAKFDRTVKFFLACAARWYGPYQGGNMGAFYDCYLTAGRDVLGLQLPAHENYSAWEQCAIHGGFRWMHEEFCMVSDFPEILKKDDQNRPHAEGGPSHRWRDGWELYFWHGVKVTRQIIMAPETITIDQVRKEENAEVRRMMIERMGWDRFCAMAELKVIHRDTLTANFPALPVSETVHADMRAITSYRQGSEVAELLESSEFKDFDDRPLKFVRVTDPSTGENYVLRVWPENKRAYEAIAQTFGMTETEYRESIATHS